MEWTEKTLLERIKERWVELDPIYTRLKDAREYICDFFRPDLGVDYDEEADMLLLGGDISEGSGPWIARTASTCFQGNTISKKLDWFDYTFSDDRLNGIDILDEFRQDSKKHNSAVYQNGNLYEVQPQMTLDGWTTGSPLMFIEEEWDTENVMCIPIHYLTYRILYDRFNRAEGVIIKDEQWTAKKCFDKFCPGRDIAERLKAAEKKFTTPLFNDITNGRLNAKHAIWRAVFKSTDPIWDNSNKPVAGRLNRHSWFSAYFEDLASKVTETDGSNPQNKPLLYESYSSKPFVHWDYDKKTWESASRTPAFYAIYDKLTLIQIFRNWIDNVQLRVKPSMAVLTGMDGRLDFRPGGLVRMKQNEWNYIPRPIEQIGEVNFERDQIEMLRENLSRHFHLEMFRMFTDLTQNKNQELKVLQIMEIAGEKVTMLLPAIEAHEQYLYQIDERVRSIEMAAGRGPYNRRNMENVLDAMEYHLGRDMTRVKLEPQFTGTLRQAQQRQQRLQPIRYSVGTLAELGEAMQDPNYVRFMLKQYETGDAALQAIGCPEKLINEKADVERLYAEYQQAMAQREQFERMVELMKATKGNEKLLEGAKA